VTTVNCAPQPNLVSLFYRASPSNPIVVTPRSAHFAYPRHSETTQRSHWPEHANSALRPGPSEIRLQKHTGDRDQPESARGRHPAGPAIVGRLNRGRAKPARHSADCPRGRPSQRSREIPHLRNRVRRARRQPPGELLGHRLPAESVVLCGWTLLSDKCRSHHRPCGPDALVRQKAGSSTTSVVEDLCPTKPLVASRNPYQSVGLTLYSLGPRTGHQTFAVHIKPAELTVH
jgi:hypothetical protein